MMRLFVLLFYVFCICLHYIRVSLSLPLINTTTGHDEETRLARDCYTSLLLINDSNGHGKDGKLAQDWDMSPPLTRNLKLLNCALLWLLSLIIIVVRRHEEPRVMLSGPPAWVPGPCSSVHDLHARHAEARSGRKGHSASPWYPAFGLFDRKY